MRKRLQVVERKAECVVRSGNADQNGPAASLYRSSCMGIVKFITLKLAIEKNIPFIGYGWSPGQAPVQSSVMKINADFIKSSYKLWLEVRKQ